MKAVELAESVLRKYGFAGFIKNQLDLVQEKQMHKPRVWIPLISFYNCYGGAEKQAEKLSLEMTKLNIDVNIICADFIETKRNIPQAKGFNYTLLPFLFKGKLGWNRGLKNKISTLFFLIELFFYLIFNSSKYDVLQNFFIDKISIVTVLAGLITRKPVILIEATIPSMNNPKTGTISKLIDKFLYFIYKKATLLVAISDQIYDEYLNKYNIPSEKVKFIRNGVEIYEKKDKLAVRRSLNLPEDKKIAVITARFHPAKNHLLLIKAWKLVAEKNNDAVLICLGDGEDMPRCKNYVQENHLENNVIFQGAVNNVAEFLQTADLFVFPSEYEGMPNAVAEAMSAALPCIVSKIMAHESLLEDNKSGIFFDLNDNEEKFAEIIMNLLNNPEEMVKLGKNAREKALEFSLDKIAQTYYDIYKSYKR